MGYYVDMKFSGVVIPKDKVEDCLSAVNELFTDENLQKYASGACDGPGTEKKPVRQRFWYSWVRNPPEGEFFDNLEDALSNWDFEVYSDNDDNVMIVDKDFGKMGDEEILFRQIAPFVKDGATIKCTGEDDEIWRYLFTDGKCVEQEGVIFYT